MSRWLLVGEGPSEVREGDRDLAGFIRVLIEQVSDAWNYRWPARTPDEVELVTTAALARTYSLDPPQPTGMSRVAARALRAAGALQCDAVVVLIDRDNKPEREGEVRSMLEPEGGAVLPSAWGVATEMLEAWIVADHGLYGGTGESPRAKPEELWGADGADGHPRTVCRRLAEARRLSLPALIGEWRYDRASARAPRLREFAERIERLLGA